MSVIFRIPLLFLVLLLAGTAVPADAWTPESQRVIAELGVRFAPPDLYRQVARNPQSYFLGVDQPFQDPALRGDVAPNELDTRLRRAVEEAILALRAPRPFNEIVYRLGIVAHYVAAANNPLHVDRRDPEERRYYSDYLRYLQSVEPRVKVVFYGFRPHLAEADLVDGLLAESLGRGRELYPIVGREYRRIGFRSGLGSFDDRSTAYAVASLAYSHAVSDIAEVLRYIWLAGGGIDARASVHLRGHGVILLPRRAPETNRHSPQRLRP